MIQLLDFAVRSSVILLVGLALMPLLRRQSAALRHWVLFASLLCAAVAPAATWVVPDVMPINVTAVVPQALVRSEEIRWSSAPQATTGGSVTDQSMASPMSGGSMSRALLNIWMAGAALSLVALAIGLLRLKRVDATASPVTGSTWTALLAGRRTHHDSSVNVAVRATSRPGLLLVWGVVRPTIIVPTAALSWSAARISAVVNHELAHIRRQDWLVQIVAEAIRAVYWFNPLVWIACARLRAECEVACDDLVIGDGAAGAEYATHVVDVARELSVQFWLPAPAIARTSTLERRVKAMLDKTINRRPLSRRMRSGAVALVALLTLGIAAIAAQSFVSLSGTISDASNGVLPGVKLILTNEETQAKYEIQSDRTGRYEFVGLPPGSYTMEAALPGFSRFRGRVTVGSQNVQQDLTMAIGMVQETITITYGPGAAPPLDPELQRKLEVAKQKRAQMVVAAEARCGGAPAEGVRMGGNIRVPMKLRDVRPHYPEALRDTNGTVVLNAQIATNGSVEDVQVVSSPHPDFTQSAIDAVRQWEFDATLLNCERIATPIQVTVNYKSQ
jgi:TonB family protein